MFPTGSILPKSLIFLQQQNVIVQQTGSLGAFSSVHPGGRQSLHRVLAGACGCRSCWSVITAGKPPITHFFSRGEGGCLGFWGCHTALVWEESSSLSAGQAKGCCLLISRAGGKRAKKK